MENITKRAERPGEDTIERAAKAAHEANRALCEGMLDDSQVPWEDAPENIKQSVRDGVWFVVDNPLATPEQQHENWLRFKEADGWVYGEIKDVDAKTHPCMVAYSDLPIAQRMKDTIFGAVVRAVLSA